MQIIKKYANRKLYHTNKKQYITLEGIAQLVQHGEAVQILDNETGDDITASILAQVVLQARGRSGGPLPTTVLTGLIQVGGDTLASLRKALFTSLGGQDLIAAEIGARLDRLVDDGSLNVDEANRMRRLLLRNEFSQQPTQPATDELEVPSRNDLARLHAQVDSLASTVEQLLRGQFPRLPAGAEGNSDDSPLATSSARRASSKNHSR
ncbi:MAG: pesticidal protein Cry15Aa [Chloroflexaceae bacterium]|jgi:polyhydroxyalkanoate synthesis repressor PhaR|nr:pesticidal protein Cry15Aa [Chloroflexaceae bacterium]